MTDLENLTRNNDDRGVVPFHKEGAVSEVASRDGVASEKTIWLPV